MNLEQLQSMRDLFEKGNSAEVAEILNRAIQDAPLFQAWNGCSFEQAFKSVLWATSVDAETETITLICDAMGI